MVRRRHPLAALAVLVVYLAVHVGAAGLHQHAAAVTPAPAAGDEGRLYVAAPAGADEDDDHVCVVCQVLHLASVPASAAPALTEAGHTGEAVIPPARTGSRLRPTSAQPRAPPAA